MISLQSKNSQKSSPAPQLENISSSVLSLLYGPTLTSIHNYWRNHHFDYADLCWQNDISAFSLSRFVIAFIHDLANHLYLDIILQSKPGSLGCPWRNDPTIPISSSLEGSTDSAVLVIQQRFLKCQLGAHYLY